MRPRFHLGGLILILVGVLFLLDEFGVFSWVSFSKLWPLILVAIGLSMLFPKRQP